MTDTLGILDELVAEYRVVVPEPTRARDVISVDVDPNAPLPEDLPGEVAALLRSPPANVDRSSVFFAQVACAFEWGLSDEEIVVVGRHSAHGQAKYGAAIDDETARILAKLPPASRGRRKRNGHAVVPATSSVVRSNLPAELWDTRPLLDHVRRAAWSMLVSPDAVLGALLCRVAALVPHTVELPPIQAGPSSVTFYAALVGAPGVGKSAANSVARRLLPAPDGALDGVPIGSGEGLIDIMFGYVSETGDDGKTRKVKRQTRHSAIVYIDEGSALGDLASRRGSTLMPTLRSAWTGETIGNANATAETRRILPGGTYVYGVTMSVQPEKADALLADVSGGLPQRFVWFNAVDPNMPDDDIDWPGSLEWEPPTAGRLDAQLRGNALAPYGRQRLAVANAIAVEIRAHRRAVGRAEVVDDPLDQHAHLARLKVASLLAILDDRGNVTEDDWHLAGIVLDNNREVRASVERSLAGAARRREDAATERHTRRELAVDISREQKALATATRAVARAVARHAERGDHDDRGCTRRCLTQAISGKYRDLVTVDDAATEAEERGWIACSQDRWTPGESRPA